MRTFMTILVSAVTIVALTSCGNDAAAPTGFAPGQSVEAYAYVHGGYVGQVVVTTDAEGTFEVTVDEAFLPHTLATVDIESAEWNEDNTVTYVLRGDTIYVARHVSYAGTNYVGTTVGTALVYVEADEAGNPAGGTALEMMLIRNEVNMAAWFDNAAAGEFQIYTEFGGTPIPVTTTPYGGVTKRGSEYWNFGIGWHGNLDALGDAAEQYGVAFTVDEMTRGSDDEWRLADATTGATLSDFPDYFGLVQRGVARLEMTTE